MPIDPPNGISFENRQTGIRKNYDGSSDDEAYYVQYSFRFHRDTSFAFIAEFDCDVEFESNPLVILGADQSKFRMEVLEFKGNLKIFT
ncbi:MAG: hypothetical protein IPL67_10575 [Ignavibacteria bacterium]|nr:hypothetical protein [Ignavibacteria bacterium]